MSERQELMLLAADRQEGKSTRAMAWVSNGVPASGYPGWSRVLVCPYRSGWDWLRRDYWPLLRDFDHRVYTLQEWVETRAVNRATEVCVDDLDAALRLADLRLLPGRLVAATVTTRVWEPEPFRPDTPRSRLLR